MAIKIEMPKLSDTMSEGKILSWRKKEGDPVEAGEIIAEVESDKANMEMEAYDAGYLRKLLVAEGEAAPVGAPIAILTEEPDEDISETLKGIESAPARTPEGAKKGPAEAPASAKAPAETAGVGAGRGASPLPALDGSTAGATRAPGVGAPPARRGTGDGTGRGKVIASPLAFRMAAELGLNLTSISGSGPAGRVVKRDIDQALAAGGGRGPAAAPPLPGVGAPGRLEAGAEAVSPLPAGIGTGWVPRREAPGAAPGALTGAPEDVPVSSMRKIIAERLTHSKVTAPHFYASIEIDMEPAIRARDGLNGILGGGITFNDMIVKAAALCLMRHRAVNASWQGESIRHHASADIGVAVSIPDGLIVPVVRGCHLKGLAQISQEIKGLAQRAQDKKLHPDEYRGGTFTVSNLGMLGVSEFTGVINPPEACLLAVGAIRAVPVVDAEAIVPGKRMTVTLSCDHRVVDGVAAARFLKDLKEFLENPVSLAL